MKYNDLFSFNQKKAIEVIVYFAQEAPIADVYHLVKVCYFADLLHLERYERTICGDKYKKMKYGPVPIHTYETFNALADFHPDISRKGNAVLVSREPNYSLISESDLECLQESISKFGRKSFTWLKNESHDAAWHKTKENQIIDYVDIFDMLPNANALKALLNGDAEPVFDYDLARMKDSVENQNFVEVPDSALEDNNAFRAWLETV